TISTGLLIENPVTQAHIKDLVCAVEALESICLLVSGRLDSGKPVGSELFSVTKIAGSEFFWQATDTLMQALGGRGYIETNVAPQLLRDARVLRIFEGPTETLLADLGSRLTNVKSAEQLLREDLGCSETADRFLRVLAQLRALSTDTTVEHHLTLTSTAGRLAFWAILQAVNKSSSNTTRQWITHRFNNYLQECLANELWATSQQERQRLADFLRDNDRHLRNIDQQLAGEDSTLDIILRPDPATGEPVPLSEATSPQPVCQPADAQGCTQVLGDIALWFRKNLQVSLPDDLGESTFAELGLDSLHAAILTSDLSAQFGITLELTDLWSFPTIAGYARHIMTLRAGQSANPTAGEAHLTMDIDSMSERAAEEQLCALLSTGG